MVLTYMNVRVYGLMHARFLRDRTHTNTLIPQSANIPPYLQPLQRHTQGFDL